MNKGHFFTRIHLLLFIMLCTNCFFSGEVLAAGKQSFYLRAGSGIALSGNSQFSDIACNSSSPAALFGCSPGNDNGAIGAYGDFGNSAVFDFAMGYRWNDWLRSELSLAYRPGFAFSGTSNFNQISTDFSQKVEADLNSLSGLLVFLIKPISLLGMDTWAVEPVVTAGAGFVHNRIDSMAYTFPSTMTITPDGAYSDFSWTIGAGFSYALSEYINIELLYRYVDLGEVRTDEGTMIIKRRSTGAVINDSIRLAETKADLESNEVVFSVVWYF